LLLVYGQRRKYQITSLRVCVMKQVAQAKLRRGNESRQLRMNGPPCEGPQMLYHGRKFQVRLSGEGDQT